MSNIYYWEKLAFSKLVQENFLEKEFEEMHWLWIAKQYKVYSRKHLFWHYYLQLSFIYKTVPGGKRLLLEFLKKWGWFQGHNERLPKYLY